MAEKHLPITGGCLCGAVRYEVSQLPDDDVGYCHCRMCQKATGALFGYFVIFDAPNSGQLCVTMHART